MTSMSVFACKEGVSFAGWYYCYTFSSSPHEFPEPLASPPLNQPSPEFPLRKVSGLVEEGQSCWSSYVWRRPRFFLCVFLFVVISCRLSWFLVLGCCCWLVMLLLLHCYLLSSSLKHLKGQDGLQELVQLHPMIKMCEVSSWYADVLCQKANKKLRKQLSRTPWKLFTSTDTYRKHPIQHPWIWGQPLSRCLL